MRTGFYKLLEADPGAPHAELRAAYTRAAAELNRRRRFITDNRGDPSEVDLTREALDEAWAVLSDPVLRRHYDALVVLSGEAEFPGPKQVWKRVSGAMVHPHAGAAADLLRITTTLKIGPLPPVPRPEGATRPQAVPDEEATWVTGPASPTPATRRHAAPPPITLPPPPADPPSRVTLAPLPTPEPAPRRMAVEAMIDRYGYTGLLLKKLREARGLSLEALSARTRITVRFLEAFEQDDFSHLPSSTQFIRSFLIQLAEELGISPEALAESYLRRIHQD
ncbi:MAG: helix-turn-helix domain-containing protein [Deltaproteobacteria bacterium]|nr:helix-turn-helix domain-containing protein [Deltaproteobacteria bacterium]